jgi:hypothetical protein
MRLVVLGGLIAACHGGNKATGDASGSAGGDAPPTADAAPDAVDATPRGLITVTVYGDGVDRNPGTPVPGANVYFVEPDQTVTEVVTGTDGIATALEPDNTTVWIVHHESSIGYYIETYEGVLIGDSIIGGNPTPLGPDTVVGNAYVAFPSFSDSTSYKLTLSCTAGYSPSSSSPIAPNFVACPQEMTANAVVTATDSTGNFAYTSASNVDLTAHTSSATALVLPAFQPGATITVAFTNLPSTMGESSAQLTAFYMNGTDPTILQNVALNEGTLTDTMTGSASIAPVGDHTRVGGLVYIGANAYTEKYDGPAAALLSNVNIDASTMIHPAKLWQYDPAAKTISWFQESYGVDPTVVQSYLSWNAPNSVAWNLTAPYSGGPVLTLPPIPPVLTGLIQSPSAAYREIDLTSYAGKTYHDAIVGHVGTTPSWRIGVQP